MERILLLQVSGLLFPWCNNNVSVHVCVHLNLCTCFYIMSDNSVSMATNLRVNKQEDTTSVADSGHETDSVITAATFTGVSQLSDVRHD